MTFCNNKVQQTHLKPISSWYKHIQGHNGYSSWSNIGKQSLKELILLTIMKAKKPKLVEFLFQVTARASTRVLQKKKRREMSESKRCHHGRVPLWQHPSSEYDWCMNSRTWCSAGALVINYDRPSNTQTVSTSSAKMKKLNHDYPITWEWLSDIL